MKPAMWRASTILAAFALFFAALAFPGQASPAGCVPDLSQRLPVILVHGFSDRPAVWGSANDPNSMLHTVGRIPNTYVETFDYESTNKRWIDDPAIGRSLARRIACVAASSRQANGPGKVIVIGHSMGGLAAKYAATQTVEGHKVAGDIGLVATIGTPNTGNGWANGYALVRSAICSAITMAKAVQLQFLCDGDAVEGLQSHSQQIDALPPLPGNIPVIAIAGDVTVTYSFFQLTLKDTDSDLIVTKQSALKGAAHPKLGGGEEVVACETSIQALDHVKLGSALPGNPVLPSCWHNGLPSNQEVKLAVTSTIEKYQRALAANQALAPYIGTWTVHGGKLEIRPDRTGTHTLNLGCGAAVTNCNEIDQLTFTGPVNGTLTAKVTGVSVPTGQAANYKVGDTFKLTLEREGHILRTAWSDNKDHGNPYWCDSHASTNSFTECGQ